MKTTRDKLEDAIYAHPPGSVGRRLAEGRLKLHDKRAHSKAVKHEGSTSKELDALEKSLKSLR